MFIQDIHNKAALCPHCGKRLDGASSQVPVIPRNGDIVVCAYCAAIGRYKVVSGVISVEKFSDTDLQLLAVEYPDIFKELSGVVAFLKKNRKK